MIRRAVHAVGPAVVAIAVMIVFLWIMLVCLDGMLPPGSAGPH